MFICKSLIIQCVAVWAVLGLPLASSALGAVGLVLPESPTVSGDQASLKVRLGLVDPFQATGTDLERPQAFTALRHSGDQVDRSEHLSVLEESKAFGAAAWTTEIALPHAGVYHFIMETKPAWTPAKDRFVQYFSKVQVPVKDSQEGWDKAAGMAFEIVPLTRPFGLCAGMSFTGKVLHNGKPMPGVMVEVARLNGELKPDMKRVAPSVYHEKHLVKADDQGIFTVTCPLPGWWYFAALSSGDPLQDPDGQIKPLETKSILGVYIDSCKERQVKRN